jgi:high-affinity Fe2+/Pb2+ permease
MVFFCQDIAKLGLKIWWSKMIHWVATIIPLARGELIALIIYNMKWQTKAEANAKDKWERKKY